MGDKSRFDLIAVVFFFLLAMVLEYREAFSLLEDETLSYRQILRNHTGDEYLASPSDEVVIVFTDEDFYAEYDKFPLKRVDLATIVNKLDQMGARVIGVDMLMDFNSAYGEDPVLEEAFRRAQNVLLVSQAEIVDGEFLDLNTAIPRFHELTEHGYTNISSNSAISESVTRLRIYPQGVKDFDAWPYIIRAVSMFLGHPPELNGSTLDIGPDVSIELDHFNDMYIDYPLLPSFGDEATYLHDVIGISASDILFQEDEAVLQDLSYLIENKIVLIGEVAEVAHDEFETPVGNVYGVEVIANSITTILRGGPLRSASVGAELVIGFMLLAVFLISRRIQNPKPRNILSVGVILAYIFATSWVFVAYGWVISMSYLLLAMVLSTLAINARFYVSELGQKAMIRDMFGQYLSPKVVEDLVKEPGKVSLGGEEREMTAFFSDIAGFSSISENLTPSELVQVLNEYLTEMCNIIIGLEGTVDKFEGDSIVAFWGAPTLQEDHAKLACFAAIDMNARLIQLRDKWKNEGIPQMRVRMGLNSGPMVVGNMGSQQKKNYTIMGDAVNLASRLEGANKAYGSMMMISEHTYAQCREDIDVRELDRIRVVGKNEPVTVYELLDKKNQTSPTMATLVDQFEKGLELYKQQDFEAALQVFKQCLVVVEDDGPTQTYIDRCHLFLENPPGEGWDGVFVLTEKG